MEFREVAGKRRAIRDYTDEAVGPEVLQGLIETAIQAPSARNMQPWSFWVIEGRDAIDQLAASVKDWLLEQSFGHGIYSPMVRAANNPGFSVFYHAPALVLVTATSQAVQAAQDCCLAAEMLMLAARDSNLGSCWIGLSCPWFNLSTTKAQFKIPEDYCVVAPIILGHPKKWPTSNGRSPAVVHWWSPQGQEVANESVDAQAVAAG